MSFFTPDLTPVFIPKLKDGKIHDWGLNFKYLATDLSHAKWRPGTLEKLQQSTTKLIVDPDTHRTFFADAKSKVAFQKIGYPDVEPEALYSEKSLRAQFIEIAVKQQIDSGADVIIAPYLHTPDTDDTKFSINLTLLSETLIYLEQKAIKLPVFAKLCVSSQILTRQPVINNIHSRYCEDYNGRIEGIILSVTEFDSRKADIHHLLGYANLVHQIQSTMKVMVAPIGGFGEVLLALGATAIGSGLHTSEGISTKVLQEGVSKMRKVVRIYIPEVMSFLNHEEASRIGYESTSNGCYINFTEKEPTEDEKARHYLNDRSQTASRLIGLSREERIFVIREKISDAYSLLRNYIERFQVYQREIHHQKWLDVLDQASKWSDPATDNAELEALLKELES